MSRFRPRFNPTLVRLRQGRGGWPPPLSPRFQSHAGSIEASSCATHTHPFTIGFNPTLVRLRHGARARADIGRLDGFNPTLVRLRRPSPGRARRASSCFNPTLVRLRQIAEATDSSDAMMFQSHAGSIEAQPGGRGGTVPPALFQSHAGSIEAVDDFDAQDFLKRRFNPTLVRLRPVELPRPTPEAAVSIPRWFD